MHKKYYAYAGVFIAQKMFILYYLCNKLSLCKLVWKLHRRNFLPRGEKDNLQLKFHFYLGSCKIYNHSSQKLKFWGDFRFCNSSACGICAGHPINRSQSRL